MSRPSALAAGNDEVSPTSDPFATPTLEPTNPTTITASEPAVQRNDSRNWQPYETQPQEAAYSHKSASLSSTGTHISSIYLEKGGHNGTSPVQKKEKRVSSRDPEKAESLGRRYSGERRRVVIEDDDEDDEVRTLQERKAVKILLFLAGPCVLLSFLNALWTIISLFVTALTQPVRLCARRPSFGQQLGGLLGPALNLQLKSIFTPLPPHANEDFTYHTGILVMVQLLSPFASMGMMAAAWIVAMYWMLTMVIGDPAGMDKRDDGREAVLAIRGWWEDWLARSMSLE